MRAELSIHLQLPLLLLAACATKPTATDAPVDDAVGTDATANATTEPSSDPAPTAEDAPGGPLLPSAYVATVTATLKGETKDVDHTSRWNVTGRFTETLEPRGDGFVVRADGFTGWAGKIPAKMADAPGFMRPFIGSIALASDGAFVTVDDPAAARDAAKRFMKKSGWGRKAPKAATEQLLSDAAIVGFAGAHWVDHFLAWSAGVPRSGETIEHRSEEAVPHWNNHVVEMVSTLEHRGEAPCPGAPARTCHTLVHRLRPNAEQATAAYAAMTQGKGTKVRSWVEDVELVLVAEVGTLIPFESKLTRVTTVETNHGKATDESERSFVYAHGEPAATAAAPK